MSPRFLLSTAATPQAKNLDILMKRVREVIQLCLEEQSGDPGSLELVGIQQISV